MRLSKAAFFCVVLCLSAMSCGSAPSNNTAATKEAAPGKFEEQAVYAAGESGYERFRIPALVVSAKGTILAFAEARKGEGRDWDEIDLVLKRSFDQGKTWQALQVISDDGGNTMNQPTPVLDRDTGAIWLLFCKNNQHVLAANSTDDGQTWSQPVDITKDVKDPSWTYIGSGPGHGIQLTSGRLLIPAWGDTTPGDGKWPPSSWGKEQFSYAFYSDDHGATWKRGNPLEKDMSDECVLVETGNGNVYLNGRSRQDKKMRASARSEDGGITWSKIEFDEKLPEPSCQAGMTRFSSQPVSARSRILLSHPASQTERSHLTVRLSYDEGHTWPVSKVIQEGPAAYSDLAVAGDGTILCLYEGNQYKSLTMARFNLAWLTDGADRP